MVVVSSSWRSTLGVERHLRTRPCEFDRWHDSARHRLHPRVRQGTLKTCKKKVRSKWKRKINYAGYADWTGTADGNRWTITAIVAVAAGLSAACRCNSWAGHAGTDQYDLFARHRAVFRLRPIGFTHMKVEPRQSRLCDSVGHMLSESNTQDMFWGAVNSGQLGPGNSDMHFSVI